MKKKTLGYTVTTVLVSSAFVSSSLFANASIMKTDGNISKKVGEISHTIDEVSGAIDKHLSDQKLIEETLHQIEKVLEKSGISIQKGEYITPVATSEEKYQQYGRVFPDPQGGLPKGPGVSPYAKGKLPAVQFIQFNEAVEGLSFLEQKFPNRMELIRLDEKYKNADLMSAGLGDEFGNKRQHPLYMVKVTDKDATGPKKKVVFNLSLHGIERAGVEGGLRAIEDLVSASPDDKLTLDANSTTMEEALKHLEVYFLLMNPDGWKRGDLSEGGLMYQRYNGNGVDVNRDWPIRGYTFKPYTPGSEPETKAFMKALKDISVKWDSGADLHGMMNANAFTYTMMPAGELDYFKNERVLRLVQGIHEDAQKRLRWSPLIVEPGSPGTGTDTLMTGQQWGTVWDTLEYTVTGDFGNWAGTPIGLDADVIDNEMALSHLSNNNVFHPIVEQMHVDGNKGLIFAQMATTLVDWKKEDYEFPLARKVAVLDHGNHISHQGGEKAVDVYDMYPEQETMEFSVNSPIATEFPFKVKGPKEKIKSDGMEITVRGTSANGISTNVPKISIWHYQHDHGKWGWTKMAESFNQSPVYLQSGAIVNLNGFEPGDYKVVIDSDLAEAPSKIKGTIKFSKATSYDEPKQVAYDATNLTFFEHLNKYIPSGKGIAKINPTSSLDQYDTLLLANHAYPKGMSASMQSTFANKILQYVKSGGELVLTDGAIPFLIDLGLVTEADVKVVNKYAGYIQFKDYTHHLARNLNKPGAAGGTNNRRQTYEPVPLGYSINQNSSPVWRVNEVAWAKTGGITVGFTDTGWTSLGEASVGKGKIRIIGALLPDPSNKFYHPNGVANYALTWSGYELIKNLLK